MISSDVDLSIVIVTHNSAQLLRDCLLSVTRDCAAIKAEIIVVDSASTDDTVRIMQEQFPQICLWISPDNIGFSAGNNIALPKCRGRYIGLLNPDTIVQDGALPVLMRYLDEHPTVGAVGPTLRLADGEIQHECARNLPRVGNLFPWLLLLDKLEWSVRYRQGCRHSTVHPPRGSWLDRFYLWSWSRNQTCEVEYISGACMMIRREVIQQIGLLDEASPLYLDDVDYCRRVRSAGWSIHYVAGPTVVHLWKQSSSEFKREGDLYAMVCHSIWLYLRKHDGTVAGMTFSAMACLATLLRIPICLAGLMLPGRKQRVFWRRQLHMVLGLARWAFRLPKSAPRFGFLSEYRGSANAQRRAVGGAS